jgi:predicted ATPase/DNA-binding XRE family transcriptional regulator
VLRQSAAPVPRLVDGSPTWASLLRRHRRAAGLTQEALAELAGLSVRAVSDLERGVKRAPHRDTLRALADALGLSPGERAAWEADRRRLSLRAPGPRPPRLGNLPSPPTRLVGRDGPVAEVAGRLRDPGVRLVTLTGTAGVGKTRLAIAAAGAAAARFPDGVWFVPLGTVRDAELVTVALAQTLGVREGGGRTLAESTQRFLRDKSALVLLDNCEHVLEAGPEVAALLTACPGLAVLATSRERLHLSGEWRIDVPPLALPTGGEPATAEALAAVPAVELFVERARAARADFALTDAVAPDVAAVCVRLEGLPLAIELAAAWVAELPPAALLARLEAGRLFLDGGPRDQPERLRSVRAAVDWSYDLLDTPLRPLLRCVGACADGFTAEAAGAIRAGAAEARQRGRAPTGEETEGAGWPTGDVPATLGLAALVEKSLLRVTGGAEKEQRFGMLETVREFAQERLAEHGEEGAVRRRHAGYYLGVAEWAATHLHGPRQGRMLDRLEQDQANLRLALRWAEEAGEAELGLRLAVALEWYWKWRGNRTEGLRWLTAALASGGAALPPALRARGVVAAGHLSWLLGDYPAARARLEEGLALAGELEAWPTVSDALHWLSMLAVSMGDYRMAGAHGVENLEIARRIGDDRRTAAALYDLGTVADFRDVDSRAARAYQEEALALHQSAGNSFGVATVLLRMASAAFNMDRDVVAVGRLCGEAIRIYEALHYRPGIGHAHFWLGAAAYLGADWAAVRDHAERSLGPLRQVGELSMAALALRQIGDAAIHQGDLARARQVISESLTISREIGYPSGIGYALETSGLLAAVLGMPARAVRIHGAAYTVHKAVNEQAEAMSEPWKEAAYPLMRAAWQALGDERGAAAWAEGQAMTADQAVADALALVSTPTD